MIKGFFNGQYSLGATYWIGIFGVGILIKLTNRAIMQGFLTTESETVFNRLEIFDMVFSIVLALYLLLMVRALWIAGHNKRTPGFWGWTGLALSSFAAVISVHTAISLLFPNMAQARFMVRLELSELNKSLPASIGDGLVMKKVKIVGDDMIYFISVSGSVEEYDRDYMESALAMTSIDGQELCTDLEGYFKGGIVRVVYEHSFHDGTILSILDGAECLNWLNER